MDRYKERTEIENEALNREDFLLAGVL